MTDDKKILEHAEVDEGVNEVMLYTFTGKHLDLLTLKEDDIDVEDIAHALSMQCRYNGHIRKFYSVAEHCVLLSRYVLSHPIHGKASYANQLAAVMLMHDASEAYIGDMVYHLKKSMYAFEVLEEFILDKVRHTFTVDFSLEDGKIEGKAYLQKPYLILEQLVHALDRSASVDEMDEMHPGGVDPVLYEMGCKPLGLKFHYWTPEQAKKEFLDMYNQLGIKKETL